MATKILHVIGGNAMSYPSGDDYFLGKPAFFQTRAPP